MTESERDLLMPFLRKLVQSRNTPEDEAANTLINQALKRQPNATYLLVQHALTLEAELAAARRRLGQLEGRPTEVESALSARPDFLNPNTAVWGMGAEGGEGGGFVERVERTSSITTSKKLYDFFKEIQTDRADDLESRAVRYIGRNSGKIWLGILLIVAVVVVFKERVL